MFKRLLLTVMALLLTASNVWAAEKTIPFAADCTWPPMEFLNANKQITGFTPELVVAVANAGGFKAEVKNTAWDGIFAGLAAGKYESVSSSVSITEERKKAMDFSDPYFEVKQVVIVAKASAAKSVADFKGKKIGAQIGTTGMFAAKKIQGAEAKSYDEVGLAIEDLANGRIDAVACDDPVASLYALQKPEYKEKLKIAFIIQAEEKEFYGWPVKKGDKETAALINKGLALVKASGEYDKLKAKWFSPK
jgi:polar amino acid transport system substrate-binding protein